MKKFIANILLVFYLTFSCGFNLHVHFCGKKVSAISVFKKTNEKGCCEEKCSTNCCNDKQISIKVNDNHKQAVVDFLVKKNNIDVVEINSIVHYLCIKKDIEIATIPQAIAHPPPIYKEPLYIQHCSYLI